MSIRVLILCFKVCRTRILTSHAGIHQTANLLFAILIHDFGVLDLGNRICFLVALAWISSSLKSPVPRSWQPSSHISILHSVHLASSLQIGTGRESEVKQPLTISSGLITPNWISRICLTGAEEYGNVSVMVEKRFQVNPCNS